MSEPENKVDALLNPLHDDEEQRLIKFEIQERAAIKQHDDYEEVVTQHEFTQEQAQDIFSDADNMAERQYQIAKSGGFVPLSAEDFYNGKVEIDEPEPGSAEAIYNP